MPGSTLDTNIFAHVNDPVVVVRDESIRYANQPFRDLTGDSDLTGDPVRAVAPPDTAPDLEQFCAAVQRGDADESTGRVVVRDGDGDRFTAAVDAVTVELDAGPAAALVVDESASHPAHDSASDRYERLVETLPMGVYQVGSDGNFSLVNDGMAGLFDADSKSALVGLPVEALFAHTEDHEEFTERLEETGDVTAAEYKLETLHGDALWGAVTAVADDAAGRTRYEGAVQDVTRRKEMEQTLRERELRFRRMFERHSAPMLLVDPDSGAIENANDAAAEFYGYSRDELTDMRVHDLNQAPAEDVSRQRERARREDRNHFRFQHELADGEVRTVEVHSSPIELADDERLFSVVHDVTDRVDYEERLETQRDNLDVLNQVLRHDIRNDLQLVFAYAEMLVDDVDDDHREYAERILESADHAVELTQTARDIADVMLASEQSRQRVSLRSALEPELEEVRASYPGAALTVEGTVPDVDVQGNEMLDSVFRNLLKNAVQHNDKPVAEVEVSATERDDAVTVRVADNGPGVPDRQKDDIFGKGEKGLESAGTGIGLYLVQTLVDDVGGEVWVEDNDPDGAVFAVELQRA